MFFNFDITYVKLKLFLENIKNEIKRKQNEISVFEK